MKKKALIPLLGGLLLSGVASIAGAAWLTEESPVGGVGTPATISISSTTLTKVPSTSTLSLRSGIVLNVPNTNSGDIVGHYGGCSTAPAGSTVQVIEIGPSLADRYYPIDNNVCLWVITTNTSASENIHVQEVRQ